MGLGHDKHIVARRHADARIYPSGRASLNFTKEEMETKLTEKLQELETKIREKMENEVNELKLSFRKGVAGPATDQASGLSRLGRRTTTLQPGWMSKSQVLPSDDA